MNNQEYLELVAKRKQEQKPVEIKMPSGATWLCLPISLGQYAAGDKLPTGLYSQALSKKGYIPTEEEQAIAGLQNIVVVRDVMLTKLVFPKICLEGEPIEGSITPEQLDPEDFEFFKDWVLKGGQAAQNSFRQPNSKKRR